MGTEEIGAEGVRGTVGGVGHNRVGSEGVSEEKVVSTGMIILGMYTIFRFIYCRNGANEAIPA